MIKELANIIIQFCKENNIDIDLHIDLDENWIHTNILYLPQKQDSKGRT